MSRWFVAVAAALVFCLPAAAQTTPWAQKLFFGVTGHDFGTVPRGAKLKHRFRIKNIYAVPLRITNIRVSCGCVSFQPGKTLLQPNEESYIDIVMDAARFQGPKVVTMYVTVGPEFVSTATLTISANARQDVTLNPGEVNFGIVPAGQSVMQTVDVEYAGSHDWRIVEAIKSKDAPFTLEVSEWYRHAPGLFRSGKVGYKVTVALRPDAKPGAFREKVLLKTNDPATPVLTLCVEGTIRAALTARPDTVSFGIVKVGESASKRIVVRGNQPFRILGVDGLGEGVSVALPDKAASLHVLTIAVQPQQPGSLERELRIRTDLNGGAVATVRLHGTAEK